MEQEQVASTLSRVALEAVDGGLHLSWEVEGAPVAVRVSAGVTPVALEHRLVTDVPAGVTQAVLPGLGPQERQYVSVALEGSREAVVVGERRLAFEGPTNFRDIGGYAVAGGGRTRWGRVFRSDGLHRFNAADLAAFGRLGVRRVYDLRGEVERSSSPDPVESVHLPLLDWYADEAGPDLMNLRTVAAAETLLHDVYVGMLRHSAGAFGDLLGRLATPEGLPAVLHCAGGKDRTGMATALLLGSLGVGRDAVLDDYELTGRFRNAEHEPLLVRLLLAAGIPDQVVVAFLGSPRWAMAGALDWLDREHASVEAYLLGPGGMAPDQLSSLRCLLVERSLPLEGA